MVADLHIHTHYSSGELSPIECVKLAKEKGVRVISVTDKNSVKGVREAVRAGEDFGVEVVPGIEIKADRVHILGYFVDVENEGLMRELLNLERISARRIESIFDKIKESEGLEDVSFEEVVRRFYPNSNIVESHLARYFSECGCGSWRSFMKKILDCEGEFYCEDSGCLSRRDAIKLIRKYGGVPVLAHLWSKFHDSSALDNIEDLIEAGLMGIEIDNGDRSGVRNDLMVDKIRKLSEKHDLVMTSGSDFHSDRFGLETGSHRLGEYNSDYSIVEKLKELKEESVK